MVDFLRVLEVAVFLLVGCFLLATLVLAFAAGAAVAAGMGAGAATAGAACVIGVGLADTAGAAVCAKALAAAVATIRVARSCFIFSNAFNSVGTRSDCGEDWQAES